MLNENEIRQIARFFRDRDITEALFSNGSTIKIGEKTIIVILPVKGRHSIEKVIEVKKNKNLLIDLIKENLNDVN